MLWNDAPIQGVRVKLCQQWIQFMVGGDCRGEHYSASTDAQGRYEFAQVAAGSYYLATHYPGQTNSSCWSGPFAVVCTPWVRIVADKRVALPKVELVKQDIELSSSAEGEEVRGDGIVLRWRAYSSAAWYEVYLRRIDPWERVLLETVHEPFYQVPRSLESGEYWWGVNAFTQKGTKIAETHRFSHFTVP